MAQWSRKKVNSENLNKNNEYTRDSQFAIESLNAVVNSGLYSQDFVEHLADTPDISEAGNVGTPTVTLVDNPNATTDKPYKRFKFANLKGAKGDKGDKGDTGTAGKDGAGCYVDGVATNVNFTSDPQTQLDNKLSLSGGTMAGDIKLPAGKFVVDDSGYGLVGYYGEGAATFGNPNRGINLRGNTTRPQYNSLDVAMYSDLNKFSKTTTHYVTSNTSDLSALDIELEAKVHTRPYLIMAGSPSFYKSGGVSYLRVKYISTDGSGVTYNGQITEAISNQNANFVSVVATLPQVNKPFKIYIEVGTDSGGSAGLSAYNSAYLTVVEL